MISISESRLRKAVPALAVVLALGAARGRADEASFDFYLAGFRLGAMRLGVERAGARYTATGHLNTSGIIGFLDFFFDGRATGTVAPDGTLVPSRFLSTSNSPRALRHTLIEWRNGTPVVVSVEPPRSTSPDPAAQTGTLDPVSAGVRLLGDAPADRICDMTVIVFDGSRRTRLTLDPPVANERELSCAGHYARLEGEAESMADKQEFGFRVEFREGVDGMARVQSIEAPTNFGTAVIQRHD